MSMKMKKIFFSTLLKIRIKLQTFTMFGLRIYPNFLIGSILQPDTEFKFVIDVFTFLKNPKKLENYEKEYKLVNKCRISLPKTKAEK